MQPTQEEIEYLKSNPSYAESFNSLYGESASEQYIPKVDVTNPNNVEPQDGGIFSIGDTVQQVAGGVVDAVKETGSLLGNINDSVDDFLGTGGFAKRPDGSFGYITNKERKNIEAEGGTVTSPLFGEVGQDDTVTKYLPDIPDADTMVGAFVRPVAQFGAGFYTGGKILKGANVLQKATTGTKIARSMVAGGIADFTVFDEHEARLSDLLQNTPLENPVIDYLASDENDTWAEGKLKNAIEGVFIGGAVESIFIGLRRFKGLSKAKDNNDKETFDKINKAETKNLDESLENATSTKKKTKELKDAITKKEIIKTRTSKKQIKQAEEMRQYMDEGFDADFKRFEEGLNGFSKGEVPLSKVLDESFASGQWSKLSTDGAKIVLNKLYKQLRESQTNWDKKWTVDEIKRQADKLGEDPLALEVSLARLGEEMNKSHIKLVAGNNVKISIANEIPLIAQKVKLGTADMEQFDNIYALFQNLGANTKTIGSQSGRNLQALSGKYASEGSDSINSQILLDLPRVVDEYKWNPTAKAKKKMIDDVARLQNPAQVNKYFEFIRNFLGRNGGWDKINEAFINAILSSPKTHAINLTSNTIQSLVTPLETIIGGIRTRDKAVIQDGIDTYVGYVKYFGDAMKIARMAFRENRNYLDETTKVDLDYTKAIGDTAFGLNTKHGTAIRLPSRFLGAEDEFFKQLNYRAKLYASSVRQVRAKYENKPFSPRVMAEEIEKEMANGFDELGRGVDTRALDFAQRNTFTKALDEKITTDGLFGGEKKTRNRASFGAETQSMVNKVPALRQIMPFVRTPVNIAREVWVRTPLLSRLNAEHRNFIRYGTPEQKATAIGKEILGGTILTSAFLLASGGKITGGGSKDHVIRKQQLATGWKPYSFLVNGKYYSFERLDPWGMFFGLVGDYAEASNAMEDQDKDAFAVAQKLALMNQMGDVQLSPKEIQDILANQDSYLETGIKAMASVSKNLTSKTYLKGLSDFLEAVESGEEDKWQRWFNGKMKGIFVPNVVTKIIPDPYYRETRTLGETLLSGIPYFNQNLEPKYDATGRKQKRVGSYLDNILFPITSSAIIDDDVINEIARLNHRFEPLNDNIENGNIKLTDYKNKDGKTAHLAINEILETEKLFDGKTLYEAINELIKSNDYNSIATDDTNLSDTVDFTGTKVTQIQSIMSRYRAKARRQIIKSNNFVNTNGNSLDFVITANKSVKGVSKSKLQKETTAQDYLNFEF